MSDTIYVIGQRPIVVRAPTTPGYSYVFAGWDYSSSGGGGSEGPTRSSEQEALDEFSGLTEPAEDTPCVHSKPLSPPLNVINSHAKAASTALDQFRGTVEYSTLIYEDSGGNVGKTPLYTSDQRNFVELNLDAVPAGSNIIGVVHNHVETPGIDQSFPSAGDRDAIDRLRERAMEGGMSGGISIDPNLLLYIYDEASRNTFVYDKDSINLGAASCSL